MVLAGYRDGMAHLMRADPGLARRFPTALHLDDYTPEQLAAIARQTALSRYGLAFSTGLEEALAAHIAKKHRGEIPKHNAGLAVSLVEGAMNKLASRLSSSAVPPPAAAAASTSAVAETPVPMKEDASPPPHATPTTAAALASAGSENDLRAKAASPAVVVVAADEWACLQVTGRHCRCHPTTTTTTPTTTTTTTTTTTSTSHPRHPPSCLQPSDFSIEASTTGADAQAAARAAIAALGDGLAAARSRLEETSARLAFVAAGGPPACLDGATRLLLESPEGADADAVASALHGLLTAHGVLNGAITSRTALPLVGESAAVAAAKATDMVEAAAGGTLVIRDAGALCADRSGTAARALASALVEVDAATSAAVLVGDKEEWRLLAAAAPGLAALFPPRVVLTDLSAAEVASLCVTHARQRYGLTVAADAGRLAAAAAARLGAAGGVDGGPRNAALAAAMVAEAVGRLAVRATAAADSALDTLCSADFGA